MKVNRGVSNNRRTSNQIILECAAQVLVFGNGICPGNRFLVKQDRPPAGEVTEAYCSGLPLTSLSTCLQSLRQSEWCVKLRVRVDCAAFRMASAATRKRFT
jgi:hypothetical protein